jgi:hypothetical protein
MPSVGEIWLDFGFIIHDGTPEPHYILVLGVDRDWITIRTLTTQPHGRPEEVGCHLSSFRQGYYIGMPPAGIRNPRPTWVDLGPLDDIDPQDFPKFVKAGRYVLVGELDRPALCKVLDCAIRGVDHTPRQEKRFYAAKANLSCP